MTVHQLFTGAADLVEKWKKHGGTLYLVLTVVAAWTVVASTLSGWRPSESVAWVAGAVGLDPLERWLTVYAPPVIAGSSAALRLVMILAVLVVAVVVCARVLSRGPGLHRDAEANAVLASRAVATPWLLLFVAAQQHPLAVTVDTLRDILIRAVTTAAWAVVAVALVWILARRLTPFHVVLRIIGVLARWTWQLVTALVVVPVGMLVVLLAPILIVVGWLFQMEPDPLRDAALERARRAPRPTGAIRPRPSGHRPAPRRRSHFTAADRTER